jgi:NADP-reducing hydrogenase subunit HndD
MRCFDASTFRCKRGDVAIMTEPTAFINGLALEADSGQTILESAGRRSIHIPSLCHYKGGRSMGACGVCVVEERTSGALLPACSTTLLPGMDIRTESAAAVEARRAAILRLLHSGRHNCFVLDLLAGYWTDYQLQVMSEPGINGLCPAWGRCELQDLAVKYGVSVTESFLSGKDYPLDDGHPMFVRDYRRCIRCGRCIQACNEIQVNSAIPVPEGWTEEGPPDEGGYPVVDYDKCVHCGECIQACPVGALTEKKTLGMTVGHDVSFVRTTCPYCGVGCQLFLHVKNGRIVKVTGVESAQPNQGRLCVKGRFGYDFIYSEERLKTPLIREDGVFRAGTWDEALDLAASKLKGYIKEYGPDSIAGVSCARSINEDSYQMQKFFRAVIGTNNIDHCART